MKRQVGMQNGNQPIEFRQYAAGQWQTLAGETIIEQAVSLTVNGDPWLSFMCTPVDLEALAVGFLFNEGLLTSLESLADVRVCPTGDNVDVWLHHAVEKPPRWRRTSGCTGGVTAVADHPAGNSRSADRKKPKGCLISPEAISNLIDQLFEAQDLYRRSGGVHTSALSDGGRLHVVAEDIGRHNTLDKIAGRCLLDGCDLPRRILLTTGRISSEMLQKSSRMGASIVISRTSPSSLSIEMARSWGITLIGYARRSRFNVYTHPERITSIPAPKNGRSDQNLNMQEHSKS